MFVEECERAATVGKAARFLSVNLPEDDFVRDAMPDRWDASSLF